MAIGLATHHIGVCANAPRMRENIVNVIVDASDLSPTSFSTDIHDEHPDLAGTLLLRHGKFVIRACP